ncbi:MAG: hypothetical protein O7J95_06780 [Planctomycetota bacterium]|nr:hypothetical protein [Planctomycetota bacterium]
MVENDARPLVFGDPAPEVGDRVLRVGGADSRGFGRLRFDATSFEHTRPDLRVSLTLEREGRSFETWMQALPLELPWKFPLVSLSLAGLGVALLCAGPVSAAGTSTAEDIAA